MSTESHPLRLLRNLGRSREIAAVLLNHGFGDILVRLGVVSFWRRSWQFVTRRPASTAPQLTVYQRVRLSLEALGPTFIKFGQVMSTRPDIMPSGMIAELQKLQEGVPPFNSEDAVAVVERELGGCVADLFSRFERSPLAAGSLAQVHRAWHRDGTPLAIKIRRPNAIRDIERDLSLMQELAILLERHVPESRIFDPTGLVAHFARTVRRELNFAREGRTMLEFQRLFRSDSSLYVPRVYSDFTTESVLTMEFVEGLKIDRCEDASIWPCQPADIAIRGARIFMKMAFEFGVFHGDPHPGNLRIRADGAICLLDYGMVGMLDDDTRERLIDLFVAVAQQDVEKLVNVVLKLGQLSVEVDRQLLKIDMRDFVSNYYGVELERIHISQMLSDFITILGQHRIRCPGSLTLLIRALVTLEGIGRKLDPSFNLARHLQPFVEKMVKQRYQPGPMADRMLKSSREFWESASHVPGLATRTLKKLANGELEIQLDHKGLQNFTVEVERASNRLAVGIVMASLIVASALLLRSSSDPMWLTLPIFTVSSLLGMWLIYGIFRSGRL